jgi:hypothetical protein
MEPGRLRGGRVAIDRLSGSPTAGQDEVDAGEELLAVVVPGQPRRQPMDEWVLLGVELRPPR